MGSFGGPLKIPGVRNRPIFFAAISTSTDHNATRSRPDADAEGARRRFLGRARDSRSGNGPAVSRRRDTELAHQPAGGGAACALSRAECRCRRRYNYETTTVSLTTMDNLQSRVNHGIGSRDPARNGDLSAEQHRCRERVRIRRSVSTSNLDASTWSHGSTSSSRCDRLSVPAPGERSTPHFAKRGNVSGDAGITGNNRSRSTGVRRRWFSRAASPVSERAVRPGRRAGSTGLV